MDALPADLAATANATAVLPRLAFVHIPKTAGTSITHALDRAYRGQSCPAMTTLDYACLPDTQLNSYWLYRGHAYRRDYERLPKNTILCTVLRDPVRRARSYFAYYRDLDDRHITDDFVLEASRLAKTASVIEFIYLDSPFIIEHLRLGQLRQFLPEATLAAIGHRQFLTRALRQAVVEDFLREMEKFTYVLTTGMLALSFPLMATQLGLPAICAALPNENRSQPVIATDDADDADIRRALIDVNAGEFCAYETIRAREAAWLCAQLRPTH